MWLFLLPLHKQPQPVRLLCFTPPLMMRDATPLFGSFSISLVRCDGQLNVISMSTTGTPGILRRTASFNSASSPHSPVSPFTRSLSANSASSFGCSDFPSCIHWCDQLEANEVYEMLHFHDDTDHVNVHFHGDAHDIPCDDDDDFEEPSSAVRLDSVGSLDGKKSSDTILECRSSTDVLVRRVSAPSGTGSHASESRLSRLIRAFELNSLKYPNPNRSIHVILRGIELKQSAWERLSKCFLNYDIGVLDIAPKVKFDSDSKSYVHCRPGWFLAWFSFVFAFSCHSHQSEFQGIAIQTQATTACALCCKCFNPGPTKARSFCS